MAVRPKRKDPISTRPVYLPKVPARELQEVAKVSASIEGPSLRIYADGAPGDLDLEGLAQRLGRSAAGPAVVGGELVAALVGRPQTQVRGAVAGLAHRLAWARIQDPAKHEYRMLPLRGAVDGEEARYRARSRPEYEGLRAPRSAAPALYDGAEVQAAFRELLLPEGDEGTITYIVVTDRRLGRWDADANRWTPSAVLPGAPILVSVAGEEGTLAPDALVEEIAQALGGSAEK